ncbi:MAG: flagellar basal body-associated protein FliL [Verrucomicrobiaceae bacterium]|nr:flagellar basal body-associated protein FliL [Verrucomicrobiaceae bacterium]
MAEEETSEEQDAESAEAAVAAAAKKKKLMMLGGMVLVLLLVAGGGTVFALKFFGNKPAAEQAAATDEKHEEKAGEHDEAGKESSKVSIYDALDPAFLANFMVAGRQHYLQISLTVLARDEAGIAALHTHMPLVRNRIVMLLSGEVYDNLQTDAGRVELQKKLLDAIREILNKETGKPGIEQVFFTNFVMQ